MAKEELMCQTCANQVNFSYCTRRMEMHHESRKYKNCEGYKEYVAPKKIEPIVIEKPKIDYASMGTFGRFLLRGGHHSFRTGEYLGLQDDDKPLQ